MPVACGCLIQETACLMWLCVWLLHISAAHVVLKEASLLPVVNAFLLDVAADVAADVAVCMLSMAS